MPSRPAARHRLQCLAALRFTMFRQFGLFRLLHVSLRRQRLMRYVLIYILKTWPSVGNATPTILSSERYVTTMPSLTSGSVWNDNFRVHHCPESRIMGLLDNFAENARRTIHFAICDAAELGSLEIQPEHLLLALLRDTTLVNRLFLGIPAEEIRRQVTTYVTNSRAASEAKEMSFSKVSDDALTLARHEAELSSNGRVSNCDILLGILSVNESFAAQLLERSGV